MRYRSAVKLLIGSLVLGIGAISCAEPNQTSTQGNTPLTVPSQKTSTKAADKQPSYIEATPVPNSVPAPEAVAEQGQPNTDPELVPGQPAPEVKASLIKNPYDEKGSSSNQTAKGAKPLPGQNASGKPEAPKVGIPTPPKPGVPTIPSPVKATPSPVKPSDPAAVIPSAPAPVKPQEPQAVIPSNPNPVRPSSAATVKSASQNQLNKKVKNSNNNASQESLSASKIKIKNLPTK
ncbi:MAG: hypothetical protein ACI38Q_02620 [Candidatus Bruticola sp.]